MTLMQRTLLSLGLLLSLAGVGCNDDGGSANGDPKLLVAGRVDATHDASATMIRAYAVAEDGSQEPVEAEPTAPDESGRYRLESSVELEAGTYVVVEASDGTNEATVLVRVDADGEMTAAPMTEETTLEASVYLEVSASGRCDACSPEAIAAALDAELAATFEASSDTDAALADLRASVEARVEAEATVLRTESQSAYEAFANARVEAQAELSAALDASTSASAEATAEADYEQAIVDARAEAGFDAEVWAESAHAGAEAARMEAERVSLEGSLSAQLLVEAELARAAAVSAAMQAELEASDVTSIDLSSAFADLEVAIDAARADGATAGESIANAWAGVAVELHAQISASLTGVQATAYETWASFATTLVASLRADAELVSSASASAAVELAGSLSEAEVDLSALTTAGVDADVAGAFAQLLLHVELAASAS